MAEGSRGGEISEATLSLAGNRRDVLRLSDWQRAGWADVEKISDPVAVGQLKQDVDGWSSALDEPLSPAEADALHALIDRLVPTGYYMGRLLLGTSDRLVPWDSEHSKALLADFAYLRDNVDPTDILPVIEIDFVDEMIAASGFPAEDGPWASVAAMAFDDAVMFALFENDRIKTRSSRIA